MIYFYHHLLVFSLCVLYVESEVPLAQYCNDNSKTTTDEISKNIESLLGKVIQATSQMGFGAANFGNGETQVFGVGQCRGDVSGQDCSTCIQDAAKEIRRSCPFKVDARIWYEYCSLRYNTENIIGELDAGFGTFFYHMQNVTDQKKFSEGRSALMYQVNTLAAAPGSNGLGKGETALTPSEKLYALVQCTRDLPQLACSECLTIAASNFPKHCENSKGCRIIFSSCYARYELYPFVFPLDPKAAAESVDMTKYQSVSSEP